MNTMDANKLLQAYAKERSEPAFQELVNRYIDLVFSTALRRVGNNRQMAEDVAQQVFTDLAHKARSLPEDVMLGGWLHRHTGFVASNFIRAEQRRRDRERKALEMNAHNEPSDGDWNQLAPRLDETMDALEAADRDALVLRYFEQRDLRAVGAALGISDDAAQKRVSRAVEKLRELLVSRNTTLLPVAALSLLLGSRCVQAAPASLGPRIGKAAFNAAAAAGGAGVIAVIVDWLSPVGVKTALAAVAALALATAFFVQSKHGGQSPRVKVEETSPQQAKTAGVETNAGSEATEAPQVAGKTAEPANTNGIQLTILAADSGKPIPNALVEIRSGHQKFFGDRAGHCYINISRDSVANLDLTTAVDGFADTHLQWRTDRGEKIPATYTLKLIRPAAIGGSVVDADGQPVAGAKVGFNHHDDPAMLTLPENHEFTWIEVLTDTNGHWSINRIAPEMIRRIYGSASHPEHVETWSVSVSGNKDAERQLLAGTYVFHLGRAATVRGIVLDPEGAPIAGADILVGKRSMSDSRHGTTGADGTFEVHGCRMGTNYITAEANGFSPMTMEVVLSEDSEPFTLMLQRGKVLRMRVVGQAGEPVSGANVWLNTFNNKPLNAPGYGTTPIQANFETNTDKNGQMVWSNAPDADLEFDVAARGYMRKSQIKVRPDDQEHLVTLSPALTISGNVTDAETGEPIPRFKMIVGWPATNWIPDRDNAGKLITKVEGRWPSIERYWISYSGGTYKHVQEEPALYGQQNPGYMFKFEADDYAPLISRVVAAEEGTVRLDVVMHRATTRQISVLLPDGSPAADTDIGLVVASSHLYLTPGGFSRERGESATTLLHTDANGRFRVTADPAISRVIAANRAGYAESTPAALTENPTFVLQPWGRLEGTYFSGGRPATNQDLLLQFTDQDEAIGLSFDFITFKVTTDAQGQFVFPQAPPGKLNIIHLARVPPNGFAHQPLPDGDVEIRAGETTTKSVGVSGYTITARIAWPDGIAPDNHWHIFVSAYTAPPQRVLSALDDPAALAKLQESPEIQQYTRTAKNFQGGATDSFSASIENVAPGDYVVSVMAFQETKDQSPMKESVAGYSEVIHVPAEPATGSLDAGNILLRRPNLAQNK